MKPYLVILAGPSGVGKTTLAEVLLREEDRYAFVRSVTTRAPRGDGHDDEYLYLSQTEFREEIARGRVLEHTEYNGNLYGTPKSEVERIFSEGKTPLLILDMNGVRSVKERADGFDVIALYLYAPLGVIDRRLSDRMRETGDVAAYEKRRRANVADYLVLPSFAPYFDAFVENAREFSALVETTKKAIATLSRGLPTGEDPLAIAEDLMLEAKESNDKTK